jgi:hypothetical protein
MDDWCVKRAAALSKRAGEHIMAGRSLEAPGYRMILGESRAYMAMRSFIHGSIRQADHKPRPSEERE